jgi:hypothetical protein
MVPQCLTTPAQLRPEAGAMPQRTLEAVGSIPLLN